MYFMIELKTFEQIIRIHHEGGVQISPRGSPIGIMRLSVRARLFIGALWSPAGKGLTSWLSFVVSNCEFVTFHLVFWVRCGI